MLCCMVSDTQRSQPSLKVVAQCAAVFTHRGEAIDGWMCTEHMEQSRMFANAVGVTMNTYA